MPNRLDAETSPYLLQHAENPVDWYPWSDEAFALARERGVPVLLSIGYSACHWCHVMAHESFEDEATAALMNKLFVNVKVDREERPDVDKIYQTAQQLLTQRTGGWPLTMFLSPYDQRPFFGGTYFPNEARYGMPAFGDLLEQIADYYAKNGDDIRVQGDRLVDVFERLEPEPGEGTASINAAPIADAGKRFAQTFDRDYGGFGSAPKFPHPTMIDRLLRQWRGTANDAEPDLDALFMATLTLKRMADGGIYDHLGGGFCRYSVDQYWQIPHFEKMLYDNGPLLALYAQASLATGDEFFATVASETADWMLDDMRAPNGGFYSSRDADSDGEEGKFYVWTPEEVDELVDGDAGQALKMRYGVDDKPNFEGKWHLTVAKPMEDVAKAIGQSKADTAALIDEARATLLAERSKRIPPGRDDKQLTSWNALAIRGFAIAGRALERDDLGEAAGNAIDFIRSELLIDGRLRAAYKDGRARFSAYLDDHAFMLDAILESLQTRWSSEHLAFAIQLADDLLEHFEDSERGGFWFTANDHEDLMHRPRPFADEATPSGNGIAAFALQRLGFLLGEGRYLAAAERTLVAAWRAMSEYPHGHVSLLTALEEYLEEPEIVIIRGASDEIQRWSQSAAKLYAPRRLVFAIPADAEELPGALADRAAVDGETVAYRCLGSHCELPVSSWEALAAQISGA
ncbi:MAG: thioredoxin domain-containing protein [Woeseiaceae bacterium]|nr:thioredoxin domain-containing protein [Woeseiaceae bacterium]